MKDFFKESVNGLKDLLKEQITFVDEVHLGERRCKVSVS
jgi:hypothetical protein